MHACQDCQHVLLDKINPEQGACLCGLIEAYREKIAGHPRKAKLLEAAKRTVDRHRKFDYPNVPRHCERFINKTPAGNQATTGVSQQHEAL